MTYIIYALLSFITEIGQSICHSFSNHEGYCHSIDSIHCGIDPSMHQESGSSIGKKEEVT